MLYMIKPGLGEQVEFKALESEVINPLETVVAVVLEVFEEERYLGTLFHNHESICEEMGF